MQKHYQKAGDSVVAGTLYVVATPIGNLADITLRALAVLAKADVICAEDTRITSQLLSAYQIRAKLLSVREHNEQHMADKVIEALLAGKIVAQVSDAGTPAVCDPGARLAVRVRAAGYRVVPIAGPSAVMAALSVAGVTEPHFYFHGFVPAKTGERQRLLQKWVAVDYPVVAFETPHRIESTLADMAAVFPQRTLVLAREISKTFETFLSGSVAEVQAQVAADEHQRRGEMVLVLHPAVVEKHVEMTESAQQVLKVLAAALPTKQAAELTAKITGESKKALYDLALTWKA